MTIYGLTGKTGAGKSTVAKLLKENGVYIIDGDIIARSITEKGEPALKELSDFFGEDILFSDGSLNRKALAEKAFKTRENTDKLNSITHPKITEKFKSEIKKASLLGHSAALIDAAALLESDCKNLCHKIIVVSCPEDIRMKRILKRDNITKEEAQRRMSAQFPDEYYEEKADIIIKNYPPFDADIKKQITDFLEKKDEN